MMVMRKGMGKGRGRGYKNLTGKDPRVHSQSARGMKQPQKISIFVRTDAYEFRVKPLKPDYENADLKYLVGGESESDYKERLERISKERIDLIKKFKKMPDNQLKKEIEYQDKLKAFIKAGKRNPWLSREVDIADGDFVVEDFLEQDSFAEITNPSELSKKLGDNNLWAINVGFVYKDLAFINQVNGGTEWGTFKYDPKTKTAEQFESISGRFFDDPKNIKDVMKWNKMTIKQLKDR